ncbi:carbon-nitrogen hydrolase family protein [Roseomonas sp. CECT 9278]|uniref:carbon-nitrogen hydrolase family protein n=1 Tax=Roseomonas sp. CECT 9278 TaxID=2845823 RepID=UPI001E2C4A6B|nr:carbon-nitrogen hydrolase family protein [Roseomonas sp. CECT 9278]
MIQPDAVPSGVRYPKIAALELTEKLLEEAARAHPDIVLLPEILNVGFSDDGLPPERRWQINIDAAVDGEDDIFIQRFQQYARQNKCAVAVGALRRAGISVYDSMFLFDQYGELRLLYDKVHLAAFDFEARFVAGKSFSTATLHTRCGLVQVGCMICYDREFPESARCLMLGGAEIVLTANCCVLDQKRIGQFQARAFENAIAMAMANYAQPLGGRSLTVDAEGEVVAIAGGTEQALIGAIDLDKLRHYRSSCGWGDAFRRPNLYAAIGRPSGLVEFDRRDFLGRPFEK